MAGELRPRRSSPVTAGKPHLNELAATDKRRAAYVKRYFDQEWTDRRLYHMMINSCMGFEAMIEATIIGAGLHSMAGAGKSYR